MDEAKIRDVLLSILRVGLLRIRAAGLDGRADECAREADHLHNLPMAAQRLTPEDLEYYYNIERPAFAGDARNHASTFIPLWQRLGELLGMPDRP